MKIGLLTYNKSANYGAVLQCYATCRILKELGHNVELINVEQEDYPWWKHAGFYLKDKAFDRFQERFYAPKTRLFHNVDEIREAHFDYDCLLVGSDQTWNPDISKNLCMAFFLDFGKKECRRISYASSFGFEKWPEKYNDLKRIVSPALSRFQYISVREETGRQILKETFGIDAIKVLDPTLLFTDYSEVIGQIEEKDEVVSYLLNRSPKQLKEGRRIAKLFGCTPKMISTIYPYWGYRYIYPPSMERWLQYMGGAKLVITDSFHGVVFSLIFRRNFVVITPENGRNSRLVDLLRMTGLEDRYHNENETLKPEDITKTIDYDKVNSILDTQRKISVDFLKTSLI